MLDRDMLDRDMLDRDIVRNLDYSGMVKALTVLIRYNLSRGRAGKVGKVGKVQKVHKEGKVQKRFK